MFGEKNSLHFQILKRTVGTLLILIWFSLFPLNAQPNSNIIVDPLLQRPWIPDAEEEESRSFHRFLSEFKNKQSTLKKKDIHGRNYLVSPSGRIRFLIDDEYRKEFPVVDEADIAAKELEALYEVRKEKEAVFLGKGIHLCYRLKLEKEPGFFPTWLTKSNEITNRATSEWSDQTIPLDLVSEPYGCYVTSSEKVDTLVLESESFRYRIRFPAKLRYEGLFGNRLGVYGENKDSIYRIVRFVQFLGNYLPVGQTEWEEALKLQTSGKKKKNLPKIILSIGSSFDKTKPLRDTKNYFRFWDSMRSLTPGLMRRLGFKRTEFQSEYLSEWTEVDEIGNSVAMEMKEYYLYNAPRGYFLSLSYPKREKETANLYWQTIRSSFEVKE
ncbi:hypothetical protein ND861_08270 [Leptospira sp. 2 VSF19]|uniref:DUF1176 domain-containing protein n=1 Tax=Leptospira soteropolitanensis TaxID=2950025 RepID=A0AAW5VIV3_9LEPT|nr:hypothetical protein [Leptospira soteropolitanensis]MCW7492990.1 hypothetical protein [Leptospira soteropolitanensis]MCW7500225.1 hypothetical protein [Leptospira soteropolitanensis]MCW7522476.1 hypothetical protein [Leptospira soteropolitanensis]MCW7526332.1 hypothetical protein [Leptospira soteropolitanensis]MCW7529556.1 hypothetical protein [Leptospira soteropolitanensis]